MYRSAAPFGVVQSCCWSGGLSSVSFFGTRTATRLLVLQHKTEAMAYTLGPDRGRRSCILVSDLARERFSRATRRRVVTPCREHYFSGWCFGAFCPRARNQNSKPFHSGCRTVSGSSFPRTLFAHRNGLHYRYRLGSVNDVRAMEWKRTLFPPCLVAFHGKRNSNCNCAFSISCGDAKWWTTKHEETQSEEHSHIVEALLCFFVPGVGSPSNYSLRLGLSSGRPSATSPEPDAARRIEPWRLVAPCRPLCPDTCFAFGSNVENAEARSADAKRLTKWVCAPSCEDDAWGPSRKGCYLSTKTSSRFCAWEICGSYNSQITTASRSHIRMPKQISELR